MEMETMKKTLKGTILQVENQKRNQESQMQASPTDNKRRKRESWGPKTTWKTNKTVIEDTKAKNLLTQNIQKIQDTM